jgi:hypothetical protein
MFSYCQKLLDLFLRKLFDIPMDRLNLLVYDICA